MELIYTHNLDSDEPIMLIDKHIGFDKEDGVGIMGDQFQKELLFIDTLKKKRIQVWINSPGGIVMDGYDICNAMLRTKTKVDTYCNGIAASISGVIFMCGRTRYMLEHGLLMIHNPYNEDGTQGEDLKMMRQSLITMISKRSGLDEEKVGELMNKTSWINSQDAKQLGLCNEIESIDEMNAPRIKVTEDVKAMWKQAKVFNKVENFNQNKTMKTVANKLGLQAEASETAILEAVNKIFNKAEEDSAKAKKMEEEMNSMKAKMEEDAAKFKKMEEDYNAMKAKAEADEEEAKAKAATEAKAKAKSLVADAVKLNKIMNDAKVIESWEAKASADFEGTKSLIDSIPTVKRTAPVINKLADKTPTDNGVPALDANNTSGFVGLMNAKKLAESKNRIK